MKKAVTTLFMAGVALGFISIAKAAPPLPAPNDVRIVNVREFGALGDGKTDDTAAIEKAWAFVMDTRKPQFRDRWSISVNTVLYFPQGIYRYAGQGLQAGPNDAQTWEIKGDGVNSARIDIEKEVYFITSGRVQSTTIRDISFNGGKGVFRSTYTGNMVGGNHVFKNCYFFNYSECAIGNNANDSPYLMVDGCIFHCRKETEAIGIAWGGDIADSYIARSHFEQNAYHIKLGDYLGNAFQVGPRNLFLSFGGTKTKADIWIVPNLKSSINSGHGAIISENKFGNENFDPQRPRILLALEDQASGTDRLSRKPSEEPATDKEYVHGIKLRDNLFAGGGAPQRGLVYSRVRNTTIIFDHNQFFGSVYPYLIEFDPRLERLSDNARAGRAYVYSQEFRQGKVSNLPGYAVLQDSTGGFSGQGEALSLGEQSDDPSFVPFVSLMGKDLPTTGKAHATPTADMRGNMTAAAVQLENATSGLSIPFGNAAALEAGRLVFVDIELRGTGVRSLDFIHVAVLNNNAGTFSAGKITDEQRVFSRRVQLQPYWQRITIPFVVRDARNGDFHLSIRQTGWHAAEVEPGVRDRFECGNVRVYHAKSPVGLNREGVRVVNDQNLDFTLGTDPQQVIYEGPLTADRTLALRQENAIRPLPGMRLRVARPAAGHAQLKIGRETSLAEGEWCELIFTGERFSVVARGRL